MNRQRVLVVEDEPIVGMGIRASLGALGYGVADVVATGDQAVAAARALKPDLVLMDIRLKGTMDGIEAALEISRDPGAPVIFLTAYVDDETLARAMAAGPFGYIQKPFQDKDLQLALETAAVRGRLERRLKEAMEELEYRRGFFEALFEANPNGVLVVDGQRRIHAANQVFERMLGSGAGRLAGKRIGEVLRCAQVRQGGGCGETAACGECKLFAAITAALSGSHAYRNQAKVEYAAGGGRQVFDVLVSSRGIDYRGERLVALIIEDVTELSSLRRQAGGADCFAGMIGRHPRMREVFDAIRDVAGANVPVLVLGESGTGKELVARAIHDASPRAGKAFVPVNCGALPESLLESELFGHVRGAFTGAIRDKKGRFELADGGTVFLDEIGDLTPLMQVKLLRVLQEGTFERVGDENTRSVDVRVISATHKNLRSEVAAGRFRDDLFYRLCVVPIGLPPLRERSEDIPLLSAAFLKIYGERGGVGRTLTPEALRCLEGYAWPGNVRELQNVLQYAVIKAPGPLIGREHLPPALSVGVDSAVAGVSRRLSSERVEAALRETGGNRLQAARRLGVSRATLYRFLSDSRR